MAAGISPGVITSWLNVLRGTTYTGITAMYVQLHTGDPGAAGTANVSALTTRNALTLAAPSGGVCALATLGAFTMNATETISHYSVWSAASAGTFLFSGALGTPKSVGSGDTITFTALTCSIAGAAA